MSTTRTEAKAGDDFPAAIEQFRREIHVHCYRMTGSLDEADDLVQEAFLRAWRGREAFEGRASVRTWLYKIATNLCLDALRKRSRRSLPTFAYAPSPSSSLPDAPPTEHGWIDPYPDALLRDTEPTPEARYASTEAVSLAFQVALQVLPPRQRAVLVLRDVLEWSAREVAQLLDSSTAAVNSALQRARTTLDERYQRPAEPDLPLTAAARALLDRYVRAWEASDVDGLVALLKDDSTLAMPPSPTWIRGREGVAEFLATRVFEGIAERTWRLDATLANGQPAFVLYRGTTTGGFTQPMGVVVLTLDRVEGAVVVGAIDAFLTPAAAARFV